METIRFQEEDIDIIAELLMEGSIIAFPTDTVFGLACIYDDEQALTDLKVAKGRPETKPIPTMVASIEQMEQVAIVDKRAKILAKAFMPGALTLIMKKKDTTPGYVTNELDTIGIRMPDDEFVLSLINKCGKPLLVSSANKSGEETGVSDEQVLAQLDGEIDAIVLGEAAGKTSSTIVDISGDEIVFIRSGPIDEGAILKALASEQ